MPRITKQEVADCIAARPFDPSHAADSLSAYANLPEPMQAKIAAEIARDKAAGFSGADLRAKFGGESKSNGAERDTGLTGPMRRKVLRAHGLDSAATIARSYEAYGDGTPRVGSAHARNYGALAAERQAAALAEVAAAAEKAEKAAARKAAREAKKAEKAAQAAASAE